MRLIMFGYKNLSKQKNTKFTIKTKGVVVSNQGKVTKEEALEYHIGGKIGIDIKKETCKHLC